MCFPLSTQRQAHLNTTQLLRTLTPPCVCHPLPLTVCCCLLRLCVCPVPALSGQVPPSQLSHIIITHLGPNRFPTLKAVLEAAVAGRPAGKPLKLVVTNPAKVALEKGLAGGRRAGQGLGHV